MDYRRYLKHYGVLGMHWGVRKKEATSPRKQPKLQEDENKKKKKTGLSDRQKLLLKIGAAAVVTGLAAYGGYKIYQHLDSKKFLGTLHPSAFPTDIDPKKVLGKINPHFTKDPSAPNFLGANMNCGNSTMAAELCWRGEPTLAKLNKNGMLPEHFARYFKLDKSSVISFSLGDIGVRNNLTFDDMTPERGQKVRSIIESQIFRNFPEGARGALYAPSLAGAHFTSFRRLKDKAVIENPQNMGLDLDEFFSAVFSSGTPGADRYGVQAIRLDNAEVNLATLSEVVTKDKSDVRDNFASNVVSGGQAVAKLFGKEKFPSNWPITVIR